MKTILIYLIVAMTLHLIFLLRTNEIKLFTSDHQSKIWPILGYWFTLLSIFNEIILFVSDQLIKIFWH
jgi:hypothetical protein